MQRVLVEVGMEHLEGTSCLEGKALIVAALVSEAATIGASAMVVKHQEGHPSGGTAAGHLLVVVLVHDLLLTRLRHHE